MLTDTQIVAKYWNLVCQISGIKDNSQETLSEVLARYSEPDRHYHNITHIASMLRFIGDQENYPENLHELTMATIFHDVVYDPRAKDNEERSADYAEEALRSLGSDKVFMDQVRALILCTKNHQPDPIYPTSSLLIDADLSILGAPAEEYDRYAAAIRQEYAFAPDEDYRVGRTKVLGSFLDRHSIYLTPRIESEIGTRAKENIRREMDRLTESLP